MMCTCLIKLLHLISKCSFGETQSVITQISRHLEINVKASLRTPFWLINFYDTFFQHRNCLQSVSLSSMNTCRLNYEYINWTLVICAHSHEPCNSVLTGFLFWFRWFHFFPWISSLSKAVRASIWVIFLPLKLKKWTHFSSVTLLHDWSGFSYLLSKSFPPHTFIFWLSPRGEVAKWKTFNTFTMTGFPLDKRNYTRTHRPHILAKGLSLQMSWVIFHYPGSEESSV